MDPDQTLTDLLADAKQILELEAAAPEPPSDEAVALAERVIALHDWIIGGGFLPAPWIAARQDRARAELDRLIGRPGQ